MRDLDVALRRARERIDDDRQDGRKWQVCRMRRARCRQLVIEVDLRYGGGQQSGRWTDPHWDVDAKVTCLIVEKGLYE